MKKYLTTGMGALAICASFTACSHDMGEWTQEEIDALQAQKIEKTYENAFKNYVGGKIASDQDWGFGDYSSARTRSISSPTVANIDAPYDANWVATYLTTAKEPNSVNIADNSDNSNEHISYNIVIDWEDAQQVADRNYVFGDDGNSDTPEQRLAWAKEHHPDWVVKEEDETYVLNFKITGTWDGAISVVSSEGYLPDHVTRSNAERTVVVTGTWNLTEDQKVGQFGRIIVADGGEIVISEGKTLSSVNEAQIVVLYGGKITGAGSIEFSNGTDENLNSYNGGTISVGKFNNNGGNFYNNGTLNADVMDGGAANSCYYNHHVVHVGRSGSTANIRIYNNCQWYVDNDFRLKVLENNSYFYVGGRLETIGSEDGTGTDAYIALGNGALVEAGSLHNTGTIWMGPTSGTSVASFGYIYQLDWAPGNPENGPLANGYFANNIYVKIADQTNAILGSAGKQTAKQVFWSVIANGQGHGNGNVKEVKDGDKEILPADNDFVAGKEGCSPGFKGDTEIETETETETDNTSDADLRIIAEDLSASDNNDFDFNDVVFDVYFTKSGESTTKVMVQAAGGTLPLRIAVVENPDDDNESDWQEVHALWNQPTGMMINTDAEKRYPGKGVSGLGAKEVTLNYTVNSNAEAGSKIIVKVQKTSTNGSLIWMPLKAEKGYAAAKIAVTGKFVWCSERQSIKSRYPGFITYVNNGGQWDTWFTGE